MFCCQQAKHLILINENVWKMLEKVTKYPSSAWLDDNQKLLLQFHKLSSYFIQKKPTIVLMGKLLN